MTEEPAGLAWDQAGFFHLRTPLLPFEDFLAFSAADASQDFGGLRARLRAWLARPVVREALYLASPSLDACLDEWIANPPRELDVDVALYKYFARMTGRSTPFGLFAGCSLGAIGSDQRVELSGLHAYRRRTALDSGLASTLGEAFAASLGLAVSVRPNPTLHEVAGRWHYTAEDRRGGLAGHRRVALEPDAAIRAALARAREGATLAEVVDAVASAEPDVDAAEVEEYVHELFARDVLVPQLGAAITGDSQLDDLERQLRAYAKLAEARERLGWVRGALSGLDAQPLGDERARYDEVRSILHPLGAPSDGPVVHVDLWKPVEAANLHESVVDELHAATLVLNRLFRARRHIALVEFRDRFLERYGAREIPLLEALDEELGVGFDRVEGPDGDPSPLLDGLSFPAPAPPARTLSPGIAWLMPQVSEALRCGTGEVSIEHASLTRWEEEQRLAPPTPLPDAYMALAALAADSDEAVLDGRFRLLHLGAGSQGAAVLGRFCQKDQDLRERVERFLRDEEALRPDCLFAELVLHPEGSLANVTRRPVLRGYEIPVHGRSGALLERQIPLEDLAVSVGGGRVRLRSARLGREVIARFTSALRVPRGSETGLVRFLTALQTQEGIGVKFSWGVLEAMPVLPRVVTGRVVLALARWRLDAADLAPLRDAAGAQRLERMRELRARFGLPRVIGLRTDDDSALPLDLENALSIEVLTRLASTGAVLTELFPSPGEGGIRGPEGRYMNEIVVPFIRRRAPALSDGGPVFDTETRPEPTSMRDWAPSPASDLRSIPPGGSWCYVKLYTGRATADRVLTDEVAPLVRGSIDAGVCDAWFFVRYEDPEAHLRVRVHGDRDALLRSFVPSLHEAARRWRSERLIWRLQLDTYEREVERYGGVRGMELSEALFAADSDAVVAMIESCDTPDERWMQTLLGARHLLLDFGLHTAQRITLLAETERRLGIEFGADRPFWARLRARVRTERAALEALFGSPPPAWVEARSRRIRPIVDALRAAEVGGRSEATWAELIRAYMHLHVNRAVRSSARAQELVLVSMLHRLTRAEHARVGGRPDGDT